VATDAVIDMVLDQRQVYFGICFGGAFLHRCFSHEASIVHRRIFSEAPALGCKMI
jgi:hypothetical protein